MSSVHTEVKRKNEEEYQAKGEIKFYMFFHTCQSNVMITFKHKSASTKLLITHISFNVAHDT